MRKLAVLMMVALALTLGVVACGSGDGEEPTNTPTTNPTATLPAGGTPTAPSGGTPQATGTAGAPSAAEGQQVAAASGCVACHSADGTAMTGPTWKGLFGSTVPLASGSSVQADEAYIRESIVDPNAKVVEGFTQGIMPQNFGQSLSEQQINALIAYIKSLQ